MTIIPMDTTQSFLLFLMESTFKFSFMILIVMIGMCRPFLEALYKEKVKKQKIDPSKIRLYVEVRNSNPTVRKLWIIFYGVFGYVVGIYLYIQILMNMVIDYFNVDVESAVLLQILALFISYQLYKLIFGNKPKEFRELLDNDMITDDVFVSRFFKIFKSLFTLNLYPCLIFIAVLVLKELIK